ncbi:hypothetical protein BUALT_Bualt08G0092700 [Buddleja alternifolia]|uniref:Uncharacterized protein n=1 Tax=Buddleja alternifolia TaxID=168488 RepID=A0AAV6XC34_9LAMI|nr:hypothetical protein BUALT_Bualt08G0092700 [Buddleja alternifolia]
MEESISSHRCSYVQCDIVDEDQVKAMVDWTVNTYGGLDVIFCNAGKVTSTAAQTILELDLSEFDKVIPVHARGTAICVKQAAHKMTELGSRGIIICTSSVMATTSRPSSTDCTMLKNAVLGLMRCASQQLGVHGIRVNSRIWARHRWRYGEFYWAVH